MLQVKGNQPKLRARSAAWHQAEPTPALDTVVVAERLSGALCTWQTSVYTCSEPGLQAAWTGLARVIVVVKTVQRAQTSTRHTRYYLTSLRTTLVADLAAGIRGHWGIENKLHRTRDVHFKQDRNGIRHPQAAANMAFFNTLALKYLLRYVGQAISYAQRYFAQNFQQFLPASSKG